MKITIFIKPRRSGKSSFAKMLYLKNPNDSFIIVHNKSLKKDLFEGCDCYLQDTMTFPNDKKICIIDEYMLFNPTLKYNLYSKCKNYNIEEVIILTTSNKMYDLDLISNLKSLPHQVSKSHYLAQLNNHVYHFENELEFIADYNDEFLTNRDSIMYIDKVYRHHNELKSMLDTEHYNIEIMNNIHMDICDIPYYNQIQDNKDPNLNNIFYI